MKMRKNIGVPITKIITVVISGGFENVNEQQ